MKSGWDLQIATVSQQLAWFSLQIALSEIMIFFTKKKRVQPSLCPAHTSFCPNRQVAPKLRFRNRRVMLLEGGSIIEFIMGIRVSYKEFLSDDFGNVNKNFTMMTLKCFTSALSTNTPNTPQVSAKLEALTTKRISQWWLWTSFDSAWSINSPCRFC